ncbi:MAG: hypothetical protein RLZZ15_4409 [Verrucomicrobiota bacterium]|jgi:flagellar hook-associated protein 2
MPGIQISGLLSNSAFDWKSVVDQLIAVDGAPIAKLNRDKDLNVQKSAALATLQTSLQELQDSVQSIRAGNVFSARTVSSDTANTTWKSSSASGTAIGTYAFDVTQLATAAARRGATGITAGLAPTTDVSALTLATLRTGTAVTAGTFTVDDQQITIALTDSLQDVFDKIAAATGDVTAAYDPVTDGITLTRASGELVLGAANDTSNFLAATKLANNGTGATASSARLSRLKLSGPLAASGLGAAITAVDGTGQGSFTVNGVAFAYNVNTDSLGSLLGRINASSAGVTASYDLANDRVVFANKQTGDLGLAASEPAGGLLDALGLTPAAGGALAHGRNAQFRVNGGPLLTSTTNTLDATAHGIAGLSVTVNSATAQSLQIQSDTVAMQGAIQSFVDKFNAVQDFIETNTKISVSGTNVSSSLLSTNREIQDWASKLQSLAFDAVSGVTGTVKRLDHLGIDFASTTGHLTVKDPGKLATALGDHPDDVQAFFLTPTTGLVSKFYGYLTTTIAGDRAQQAALTKANSAIDTQIATLQSRLENEREQLTSSFIKMLDAQSAAQSQNTYLTNAFFKNNSSN